MIRDLKNAYRIVVGKLIRGLLKSLKIKRILVFSSGEVLHIKQDFILMSRICRCVVNHFELDALIIFYQRKLRAFLLLLYFDW